MTVIHESPMGMWMSKLGLRILSLVLVVIALAIAATLASGWIFNAHPLLVIGPAV